ncbi:hypothetical protein C8R43DRAFT_1051753 [Mycena crocata]|nr:hypothetical protein C8R43DRAFT_1051753 [Mycena crocata]
MTPKTPVLEPIRLKDILLPVASTSAQPAAPAQSSQTARKSTGGKPPRKAHDTSSTSPGSPTRKPQSARKSTGRKPPSPQTEDEPQKMPIRSTPYRARAPLYKRSTDAADSDNTESSRAGSSDPSSSNPGVRRPSQTARKSTGGAPPRKSLGESTESSPSSSISSLPVPNSSPPPIDPCFLCQPHRLVHDSSQPIYEFKTSCHHNFHYTCYMAYITTASHNQRVSCPQCSANLLTEEQYWVFVTTSDGRQCYTDMTAEVTNHLLVVRKVRERILLDLLIGKNYPAAALLLIGPDAVDVNHRIDMGGLTPLHYCAMYNNVPALDLLLSHGANKELRDDAGNLPIDCAKTHAAWDAVKRLG